MTPLLDKFKNALQTAASPSAVKTVDVIFNTHGNTNQVVFKDGPKSTTTVQNSLSGLSAGTRAKFRAIFSTACFGSTHLGMWTNIGFSVADGSTGIYADSAISFPALLGKWALEGTFSDAVGVANAAGKPADDAAKAYYNLNDRANDAARVNSHREIAGNGLIRIYSLP